MRTFILYSHAKTDANWNIEDMPSSAGRIDVVARCISSALWLSYTLRRDTDFIAVLNGAPHPPIAIKFSGERLKNVSPDERSIGLWLKKVLSQDIGKEWKEIFSGISAAKKSFQEVVKENSGNKIFVLHEKGKPIIEQKFSGNEVFILGDNVGIPPKDEKFAMRFGKKISVGRNSYLASSVISVLHWLMDAASM